MPTRTVRDITVFIASPGDLAPERKAFKDAIDGLNAGFADGAGINFTALGWEDVLAETGRRVQSVINREVEQCDFFVLVLHRRWGQPAPDSQYSSYTEEEFQFARKLWEKKGRPEIAVFFKNVDQDSLADPGPELKKVLAFRKRLEGSRRVLIRRFNSEIEFATEIDRHLRSFAKGMWNELDRAGAAVDLPQENIDALKKSSRNVDLRSKRVTRLTTASKRAGARSKPDLQAKADLSLVEAERAAHAFARAAIEAARKRNIEDAAILFSKASEGTTDLAILSAAAEFFRQIGASESAGQLVRRQAAIAKDRTVAARYYLTLLPEGFIDDMLRQMAAQMFPEEADEKIGEALIMEVFGGGRLKQLLLNIMVKYYSTEEILELARFMATPEAQATLSKQPLIMAEMMAFGQREAERILGDRHSEMSAGEPKFVEQGPQRQIADSNDVTSSDATALPKESPAAYPAHRISRESGDN